MTEDPQRVICWANLLLKYSPYFEKIVYIYGSLNSFIAEEGRVIKRDPPRKPLTRSVKRQAKNDLTHVARNCVEHAHEHYIAEFYVEATDIKPCIKIQRAR